MKPNYKIKERTVSRLYPTITICVLACLFPVQTAPAADPNDPIKVEDHTGAIRVSCIGDSITAGVGANKGMSYPDQLGKLLGKPWEVRNFGVSGATLLNKGNRPYQGQKHFRAALGSEPNVVIIMLGTNDTKAQNWKMKDQFAADYKDLIKQFAELKCKPRIFVCHPVPVPGGGNFGITEAGVREESPMIDAVAEEMKVGVIDMYSALKDHPETIPDKVHPNSDGAALMAKAAYKKLTGKEAK